MNNATKRSILRCIHLILTIPILGYIYGEPSEVQTVRLRCSVCLCSCNYPFGILDVLRRILRHHWRCAMARCILPGWNWGGYPVSDRAIHRAEDLVGDPRTTFTRAATIKLAVLLKQKYEQHHKKAVVSKTT